MGSLDARRDGERRAASTRYRAFGGYRLFLALGVVLSHSWTLRGDRHDHLLARIGLGNVAVMGFFVLSGFIIGEAVSTFYRDRPGAFLVNRVLRIVPPYLAALLVALVVYAALMGDGSIVTQAGTITDRSILGAANVLRNLVAVVPFVPPPRYAFVEFIWAVKFEMVFYVLVFAYLWAERALGLPRPLRVLACVGALAAHVVTEYVHHGLSRFAVAFAPYFVLGLLLHHVATRGRRRWHLPAVAGVTGLALLHFSRYTQGEVPLGRDWWEGLAKADNWVPTLLVLLAVVAIPPLARVHLGTTARRFDRRAGALSYPAYLNHGVVLTVLLTELGPGTGVGPQVLLVVVALAVAAVLGEAVERPIRRYRDGIRGRAL